MKTIYQTLSLIIISVIFVGCSSVKTTSTWKDQEISEWNHKNIMVLVDSESTTIRSTLEQDIVTELTKKDTSPRKAINFFL